METKVPLDSSKVGDLASLMLDPLSLPTGSGTSKITVEGEVKNGSGDGIKGQVTVDNITSDDLGNVMDRATHGDFGNLFKGLDPTSKSWTFKEDGPSADINLYVVTVHAGTAVERNYTPVN